MQSRSTDIIITTYNRADKVHELVSQLLEIVEDNAKIIVVDSSETINTRLQEKSEICYLRSSHKNQPYQRYLGFLASQAEILIFLDDDMEIVEKNFVYKIDKLFENNKIAGVALKFIDKDKDTSLSKIPSSKFFRKDRILKDIKGWLTGYPRLNTGKFGSCGNRGPQPAGGGETEWVSGGAFAARRSAMFQKFNYQLFSIFEDRLGMGEDGIIGYGLSKMGHLVYHDELFFLHNDQKDSTYANDTMAFAKRVAFSRLYLSLERARLNQNSIFLARIHYNYYIAWRVAGLLLNLIINPSKVRWEVLKGTLIGWHQALFFKFTMSDEIARYWHLEAVRDMRGFDSNSDK